MRTLPKLYSRSWAIQFVLCLFLVALELSNARPDDDASEEDYEPPTRARVMDVRSSSSTVDESVEGAESGTVSLVLEHSFASPAEVAAALAQSVSASSSASSALAASVQDALFTPRARLTFKNPSPPVHGLGGPIVPRNLQISPMSSLGQEDLRKFKAALQSQSLYRVRLPSNLHNPSSSPYLVASVPACVLLGASFRDSLHLHVDPSGNIDALRYTTPDAPCVTTPSAVWPPQFNTSVRLWYPSDGPRPNTELFAAAAERKGAENAEPGFLRKYWYIVVPAGLMMLVQIMNVPATVDQMQQQSAGGPGARSAAPRRARPQGGRT
mmetsp:Transcript_18190/g.31400  ORF Transcript_18190/g.31400 Transcript_18190/m.31400 type:complete len:325 (-) Transcript_18190:151-1125(-)